MIQKIRQLKLYNSRNDLIDLVNERWIFGTNPDDMGAKFGNDIFQVGANTLISKRQLESSSLKLDMYYGLEETTEYESFNRFVEFLNYTPYRLSYENDAIGEVFRDCVIAEITRPDISEDGMLIGNLTLDFLTPFYREIAETYKPTSDTEGDGKIYQSDSSSTSFNLVPNASFNKGTTSSSGAWIPDDWIATDWNGGMDYPPKVLPPESDKPNVRVLRIRNNHATTNYILPAVYINTDNFRSYVQNERYSLKVDLKLSDIRDIDTHIFKLRYNLNNKLYDKGFTARDFGFTEDSEVNKWYTCSISFATIGMLLSMYFQNAINSVSSYVDISIRCAMIVRGGIEDLPDDFHEGKGVFSGYVYPYVYESDYNGKSGVFQIENNSVYIGSAKGSPVEITVHGPCTNPYWEILDGSKVLQSDGYNIDVPDGYKLVVSSIVQNQRMKLIAPDGTISDVYQQQDLSRSNLIAIPDGHVTLAFHNVGDVSFVYREEYITV